MTAGINHPHPSQPPALQKQQPHQLPQQKQQRKRQRQQQLQQNVEALQLPGAPLQSTEPLSQAFAKQASLPQQLQLLEAAGWALLHSSPFKSIPCSELAGNYCAYAACTR